MTIPHSIMKKLILPLAILTLMLSGCSQNPSNTFTLSGTIEGKTDGEIYLTRIDIQTQDSKTDTLKIEKGSFIIKGVLDEPTYAVISDGNLNDMNNPNLVTIFIEPAKMKIALKWNDFKNYTLTGSATNDDALSFEEMQKPYTEKIMGLRNTLANEKALTQDVDTSKIREIENESTRLSEELEVKIKDFIKSNPDSYYAAFTLNMRKSYYPLDELQSYYDLMTERVKNGKDAKEILAEITKIRSLEPGNPAPVFATIDINGNPLSLSDFKGKYVILDFWASWCVPCRKANPHLKALYEKYKDKGLEVICISDDDSKPDKWREAVEKDQIGMFKHVLRGLKILPGYKFDRTNDISEPYAVHSLPTKFLIDRNGNMVGKVTSEELEAKLKEVFGE